MEVKIENLSDAALDWAVANCEKMDLFWLQADEFKPQHEAGELNYSTDWAQGGPIIEREKISIEDTTMRGEGGNYAWCATRTEGSSVSEEYGPTPLIAAMRCYVASEYGDSIGVPEELA